MTICGCSISPQLQIFKDIMWCLSQMQLLSFFVTLFMLFSQPQPGTECGKSFLLCTISLSESSNLLTSEGITNEMLVLHFSDFSVFSFFSPSSLYVFLIKQFVQPANQDPWIVFIQNIISIGRKKKASLQNFQLDLIFLALYIEMESKKNPNLKAWDELWADLCKLTTKAVLHLASGHYSLWPTGAIKAKRGFTPESHLRLRLNILRQQSRLLRPLRLFGGWWSHCCKVGEEISLKTRGRLNGPLAAADNNLKYCFHLFFRYSTNKESLMFLWKRTGQVWL